MTAYDFCKETAITGQLMGCPALAAPTDVDFSMVIKTDDGVSHRIWLAPTAFLTSINFAPNPGDRISVIGMPVGTCGDFVARQIVYGCNTYTLRTVAGAPIWAAGIDRGLVAYATQWNPSDIQTFRGRIQKIAYYNPTANCGTLTGTAVRLSYEPPDNIPSWQLPPYDLQPYYTWIHLGPTAYVNQVWCDLHEGQVVEVTASHICCGRPDIYAAAYVERGSRMYAFRDLAGYPVWAGGWRGWSESTMLASAAPFGTYMTVNGTIQDIRALGPMGDMGGVNLLTLQTTNGGTVALAVSDQAGICFKTGECVTVCGFIAAPFGQQVVVANEIGFGGQRYVLNNANGTCTWVAGGTPAVVTTAAVRTY